MRVCKLCCIDKFVSIKTLDYFLENNGNNLSGGQKQRIVLARSILQKPKILIMDEATSALDKNVENLILTNIYKSLEDSIIISITHRLENTTFSNRVFKLVDKKLM